MALGFDVIKLDLQMRISSRLDVASGEHPWRTGGVRVALGNAAVMDRFAL